MLAAVPIAMATSSSALSTLRARANGFLNETILRVDYYRIRRKLAFPLPVKALPQIPLTVTGIERYPWSIWLAWELEERVSSLGWLAELDSNDAARRTAESDLEALASWPVYREYADMPSLCLAHCSRLMALAVREWGWLSPATRRRLEDGLRRSVAEAEPFFEKHFGAFAERRAGLDADPQTRNRFHNIPLIEGIGLALAARALGDGRAERFDHVMAEVVAALLAFRRDGYTEGVAYDGYVMDFVGEWLPGLAPGARSALTTHDRFTDLLDETLALGAPGAVAEVAELSDVEPARMPHHLSAHVKLAPWLDDPRLPWLIRNIPDERLSATALARLGRRNDPGGTPAPPAAGPLDARYAAVLRTGWEADDVAVAMAASNSPMGHIHFDNGSLVIGTRGRWVLTDPGYQQYMKTREREFTTGPRAHNAPLVNGCAQTAKETDRPLLATLPGGVLFARANLTRCYPSEAGASLPHRNAWLTPDGIAAVADEFPEPPERLAWHWHFHPEAFAETGTDAFGFHLSGVTPLRVQTTAPAAKARVLRLPGSRGHLTLALECAPSTRIIWWVFQFSPTPPGPISADGGELTAGGRRFSLAETLKSAAG